MKDTLGKEVQELDMVAYSNKTKYSGTTLGFGIVTRMTSRQFMVNGGWAKHENCLKITNEPELYRKKIQKLFDDTSNRLDDNRKQLNNPNRWNSESFYEKEIYKLQQRIKKIIGIIEKIDRE